MLSLLTRIVTISYFVPVMLNKLMKADTVPPDRLGGIIKCWVALRPLRLISEFVVLIVGTWVLLHLAVAAGIA